MNNWSELGRHPGRTYVIALRFLPTLQLFIGACKTLIPGPLRLTLTSSQRRLPVGSC